MLAEDYERKNLFRLEPKVIQFPLDRVKQQEKIENGIVEFTEKEISTMPKHIKKLLIIEKKRCRIRQHSNRKGYEIRLRNNGYDISASGVTIELAKENFIRKLKTAKPSAHAGSVPKTFNAFTMFYFENYRKELVSPKTLYNDTNRYNKYIFPLFNERPISNITPIDCKRLLDPIKKQGLGKTADEIYSLLNVIFKSAISHAIISKNPLDTILHIKHEKQTGVALTRDEDVFLFSKLADTKTPKPCRQALALGLFCGLRPNEYYKCEYKPPFIIAENSKRKNKKIEYKKIPIIPALKPFVSDGIGKLPTEKYLRKFIKDIFPHHTLKDLRKTFNTRCKEYGVSDHARKHFMGHSLGALDGTYTELSDEYLLKEAEKLKSWLNLFPKCSPKN